MAEYMSLTEQTKYIVIKLIPMDKNLVLSKFIISCHQARLEQPPGSKVPKAADRQVAAREAPAGAQLWTRHHI